MALGYTLPGTIIEEVTAVTTGRPTSSQRTPCFIGKASKYKIVTYEEVTRSSTGDTDSLEYSTETINSITELGSQKGLNDFVEGTHFNLTSTGLIEWAVNSENTSVLAGSVGGDLLNALATTVETSIPGSDATSGYQGWGFSVTKNTSSSTGWVDDRTSGYQEWGFSVGKTASSASGLSDDATTYTCTITIDGSDNAVSIAGEDAQTLQQVVNGINDDITGGVASFEDTGNGFIRITSDTTGTSSTIVISDSDLFSSLSDSNVSAETASDGDNGTEHTATVTVDGSGNSVSIYEYQAPTIADLISELNSDITGALVTFNSSNNEILITSNTTGTSSTIVISDTNVFGTLLHANGTATTAVDGTNASAGYQEMGLSVSSGDASPLLANSRYFFRVNSEEYMIETGGSIPTYSALVSLIDAEITGDGLTATFETDDIRITNDSSGAGYNIEIIAGSTNSASNGELELTLSAGLAYNRYAGQCVIEFTPDGGTTNYTFGLREDASAGTNTITITGDSAELAEIDQNDSGSANDLVIKNKFLNAGATYFVSYMYERPTEDYLTYKEFIDYEDMKEDLGAEIPKHDLVMMGKTCLQVFGLPKIAVVQVPWTDYDSDVVANVSYIDALAKIRYRDIQTVCPINSNSNVQSAVKSHVLESSLPENGRYRMAWFGAPAGTPVGSEDNSDSLKGKAAAMKHERCIYVNATRANYYYVDPATNEEKSTVVDGSFIASVIGGYRDGISSPVATLMNHNIPQIELFDEDYDDYYSEYFLTQAGASSCFLVAPSGGLTVVIDDLTTDNSTVEKNNINIITAKDYIARDVAIQMNRSFKGNLIKDRSAYKDSVQGYLKELFRLYKSNSVIENIASINVTMPTTQRDTVEIFYSYYAIYTHKYTVGKYSLAV